MIKLPLQIAAHCRWWTPVESASQLEPGATLQCVVGRASANAQSPHFLDSLATWTASLSLPWGARSSLLCSHVVFGRHSEPP